MAMTLLITPRMAAILGRWVFLQLTLQESAQIPHARAALGMSWFAVGPRNLALDLCATPILTSTRQLTRAPSSVQE
jgi:hypothetical protein